jgi:hypothetical protein
MEHTLIVVEAVHRLRIVSEPIFGGRHTLRASFIAGT